jgi:endonuclease VIII
MPAHAPVRGSPWLVLTGETTKAVLRGGALLELCARRVSALGPDILAPKLDSETIVANLRRVDPACAIGEALLDQRAVAGIGSIWRSEALWHARVSPWSRPVDLEREELVAIVTHAATLMADARDGGRLRREVYRRTGRPCRRCGSLIRSAKQGDAARPVYWCHVCQQGKEPTGA